MKFLFTICDQIIGFILAITVNGHDQIDKKDMGVTLDRKVEPME